ncbi:hypothetical protein ANCDUO_07908 [Ancylostoma duodenale]|uniref:Uncharacterized protein n=1 Tax=Ancylostoma duodenale TaxID=51022 RepID=A0A0C2CXS0_9BILA|nr:hypothetical protein ANCDUO_07908 [Ancylostoma duodenale]
MFQTNSSTASSNAGFVLILTLRKARAGACVGTSDENKAFGKAMVEMLLKMCAGEGRESEGSTSRFATGGYKSERWHRQLWHRWFRKGHLYLLPIPPLCFEGIIGGLGGGGGGFADVDQDLEDEEEGMEQI